MSVRFALLASLSLLVAACAKNPLQVVVSHCPAVAVVGDVGTLTRFKGEGRTTNDVEFTASITNVKPDCKQADSVTSHVTFDITAEAGKALTSRTVTLPYFVAVLKDNSQIVSKKRYDVTLTFGRDGIAHATQTVEQFIPTMAQAKRYNYEVLLGFQLTPEEAMYNMER
ncbi:hypothetical protein [Kordiimonas marina]|uniref:hypothetical protein n=1 Tax=Kordiimonas marina TaxID=2872312 RepID=UPI001FF4FDAB|nr:hypothetical protein [Kordiimonas marina]MCJ9427624.1 hypothetical protein [Kordiimonas marina]